MQRLLFLMLFLAMGIATFAQGTVKGTIYDKQTDEPLSFVTVQLTKAGQTKLVSGVMTDIDGKFNINDIPLDKYTLTISYVGYREEVRSFELTSSNPANNFNRIYLSEDSHTLKEVKVVGQKSAMKLEVDRKTFDVSQMISSAGQAASDILENIPSIEVDNDGNVSLRGNSSVEVWINGKASGLTTDNRAQILQQLPAESIERIEVIDNPSSKFSAEGSAGIINIVLKKDRAAGYYGSMQAGADTQGGYNGSVNINYNSKWVDAFANVGLRRHKSEGLAESEQINYDAAHNPTGWQNYSSTNNGSGSPLFTRAGLTFHITKKDDISLSGMMMNGSHKDESVTPYYYGHYANGAEVHDYTLTRTTTGDGKMRMRHGELGYTHEFSATHKFDMTFSADSWKSDNENIYTDITDYLLSSDMATFKWQSRPQNINNRSYELRADYENQISSAIKLEAGYNWRNSHENTPQQSFAVDGSCADYDPSHLVANDVTEEKQFFNRFIYDSDVHALYATLNGKFGNFGVMVGLRGEYWKVDTKSLNWNEDHENINTYVPGLATIPPFSKDYFQLFPSLFLSYQLTENDQLQLNVTRRLRRPWGGQLNSFRDTRDATMISFGNPELTPEYSNSFALNYLKTWTEHSLLFSAYYRPTTDVMQRINYRDLDEDIMYSTTMNLAKSQSSGAEITLKDKFFRILDLTTNVNAYYYKLDAFEYVINNQTIVGKEQKQFTWNARMQASVILPYDISVQVSGRYRSRQAITQGTRPASYMMDFGVRKNFFNKLFTLSINCRDLLNSRRWESTTESDTFWRHQINRHNSRTFSATLTWNFGNTKPKKRPMEGGPDGGGHDMQDYNSAGMED